ncbi:MAG TPA: NAD(P)H-hydrate dehydratase [Candidatus Saccharimonadales bacterium]|nr:NAD(P)H-hydrate dehydratase [Candidatus Saccharimonadales bacterium]
MDEKVLRFLVYRPKHANKYDFGHVLIFGGSAGMVGAPLLCAEAALRIGAGLVTIASDENTAASLDKRVRETMTLALPDYSVSHAAADTLLEFARERKVKAVVVGPGLPPSAAGVVRSLLARLNLPIVLDAGGLASFYGHLAELREVTQANQEVIITPHEGEFAKLTGSAIAERGELVNRATDFAKDYQLTLVLKGYHSIVAHPSGNHYENPTGNPGLATAGTGDVLSGVIAGLLAQGVNIAQAAEAGTYVHGLAGDLAAAVKTQPGMIASDVIECIPAALKKLQDTMVNG